MAASNLVIISYSVLNIYGFYLTFYVAQIVYHKITSTNIKLGLVIDGNTVLFCPTVRGAVSRNLPKLKQ